MKALVYEGPRMVITKSVEKPEPKKGEALVQVYYAGICGSDMHIYHGVHPRAKAPLIMGHEFCGQVVSLNGEIEGIKEGDKVVIEPLLSCNKCHPCKTGAYHVCASLGLVGIDRDGGFAEYVSVPIKGLHKIPEDMNLIDAALIEPVAVAVHTVRMSRLKIGDVVVVLGAGPIGTLVAEVCKTAGARNIIITDVKEERLEKALAKGFNVIDSTKEDVVKKVMEITNGKGADIVFDVAGVQSTATMCTQLAKIRGQIVVVAVFNNPPNFNLRDINFKELDVIGVRVYNFEDYEIAIDMVYNKRINIEGIATHIFDLDEGEKAFATMEKGEGMKILFKINE